LLAVGRPRRRRRHVPRLPQRQPGAADGLRRPAARVRNRRRRQLPRAAALALAPRRVRRGHAGALVERQRLGRRHGRRPRRALHDEQRLHHRLQDAGARLLRRQPGAHRLVGIGHRDVLPHRRDGPARGLDRLPLLVYVTRMLIDAARGALTYFVSHPTVLLQAARNAARFELSVPIDLLRWAIDRRPRGKGPEKIELFDADPAIGVALTVDLYGTKLTVSARIEIESIENLDGELKVSLRVSELHVAAPPDSPAAMMINSMDLSRPGNLMKMMPQKHAALVSAEDD